MVFLDTIARKFPAPRLTKGRVLTILALAMATDAIQIALGPVGWLAPDEVLDVIMCLAACWLLGFHILLLPTFLLEVIPVVDMLPTWTGCVLLVIALRRKGEHGVPPVQPALPTPSVSQPRVSPAPPLLPPPPPREPGT